MGNPKKKEREETSSDYFSKPFENQKKIRVGINALVFKNPITGVGKRIIHLCQEMHKQNSLIIFYFFSPYSPPANFQFKFDKASPHYNWVTSAYFGEWWWTHVILPYQLLQYKIEIFDSQWGGGLPTFFSRFYSFSKKYTKIKKIITIHDLIPLDFIPLKSFQFFQRLNNFFFKKKIDANLREADKVVVVSKQTEESLKRHFNFSCPLLLSYNGIESINLTKNKNLAIKNIKKFSEMKSIKNYFFYLGGFNKRKNLTSFILALDKLYCQKKIAIPLVLAGTENQYFKKNLQPLIKKIPYPIISLGYLHEEVVGDFYRQADLSIYPSLAEGFGMPALEALSHGCPVLVDTHLSIAETLKTLIAKGELPPIDFFFSANLKNPEKILIAINNFLKWKKTKKNQSNKVPQTLLNIFSWKNITKDYLNHYENLLKHNSEI